MTGEPRSPRAWTGYDELNDSLCARIEALMAQRLARERDDAFFVEGVRNVVTAVDRGWTVLQGVFSERLAKVPAARRVMRGLKRDGIAVARASPEAFRRISRTHHASGVGLVLRPAAPTFHRVTPGRRGAWLVLERVRAPGNLGTLLRTAAATGCAGVILVGGDVDPYDPATVRASMGGIFALRFMRCGVGQLRDWLARHHLPLVGASPEGRRTHFELGAMRRVAIAVGEERAGLTSGLASVCDELVRIPMVPGVDSLNVAVAGSLFLYEALRARC